MKVVIPGLLLLVSSVFGQTRIDNVTATQVPFVNVERIGEANARSFYVFSTSSRSYTIRHDGHGEGSSLTTRRKNYDLRMNGALRIERLYFAEYDGDLVLEYEVTDGRGDWAYVLRMDQTMMRFKWVAPISAEALGPGLIEGRDLYISAVNVLAKIDMQTGAIGWQQSDFEHVSMFGLPTIKADSVLFEDDFDPRRRIEIEKQTGQIRKH
jgi:hypothetical protein